MNRAAASPPSAANAGAQVAHQQVAGRLAAHVQLVAHVQPLGGEPEDVDRPAVVEQPRQRRPELVAEEAQPLDRLVVADAEPQRAARALVERRERAHVRRPRRPRPASTASRRRSSGRRGRARCRARARSRRAASSARGLVAVGRPALEHRRREQRAPLRVADALPRRSAARSAAAARRAARARPSPAGATVTARGARASMPLDGLARWRRRSRSPCAPHSRVSTRQRSASPPAGGRQSTSHDRRALVAQRVGEGRQPERSRPRRVDAAACAHGSMAADGGPGRAGRGGPDRRPACWASATSKSSSGSAPASTATTPRSSRTATGTSSSAARRSRRRSCSPTRSAPARPRSSRTSPTCARWAAARSALVDMLVSPDRAHAETRARRHRAGRRTCSACRSSAAT